VRSCRLRYTAPVCLAGGEADADITILALVLQELFAMSAPFLSCNCNWTSGWKRAAHTPLPAAGADSTIRQLTVVVKVTLWEQTAVACATNAKGIKARRWYQQIQV